jgi:hypothetical protein
LAKSGRIEAEDQMNLNSNFLAGLFAGLVTAVCFGLALQGIHLTAPNQVHGSGMVWVAQVFDSTSPLTGWIAFVDYCLGLGALFGWFLGRGASLGYGRSIGLGLVYGIFWWMIDGLILLPLAMSMPVFSTLTAAKMRGLGLISLVGHLAWGTVLGAVFMSLKVPRAQPMGERYPRTA